MSERSPSSGELTHYGVKGMKWGVRRSETGSSSPSRKTVKADRKFEKNASSTKTWIEVHNRAANQVNNRDIDRINSKPEYRDADFTQPSKLRDKYYKEHADALNKALEDAAKSLGTNASGTRRYTVKVDEDGNWGVTTKEVKHADDIPFEVVPEYDPTGRLVSLTIEEISIKHYGVKGMKWGVRRAEQNSDYSDHQRTQDKKALGRSGVRKVNKRMNKGETHQVARKKVARNQALRNLAVAGALYASPQILAFSDNTVGSIAQRAQTKRGQAAAAQAMGLPRNPTSGPSYAKQRRGAYNISSL
jgi:hypothetical protein